MKCPGVSPRQMRAWRPLEAEHSPNVHKQERIVCEHVTEHGTGYYPALIKMEASLPNNKKK